MRIDMHSHTRGSDGTSSPEEIAREAKEAGLDGLCLTDHHTNTVDDNREVYRVAAALEKVGVQPFIGVEYSTAMNHLLIFGIDVPNLAWGMYPDIQMVIDEVNDLGGACIVPHPFKGYARAAKGRVTKLKGLVAIEGFNGQVEVKDPSINALAREAAKKMGLPITGGSDAHWASMLGVCWTEFDRDVTDDLDLCEALREGNFTAVADQRRIGRKQKERMKKIRSYPKKKLPRRGRAPRQGDWLAWNDEDVALMQSFQTVSESDTYPGIEDDLAMLSLVED